MKAFLRAAVIAALVFQLPLAAATIAERSAVISFGFTEENSSYEIGFSSSEDNPSASQIDSIPLGIREDGYAGPAGDVFVYWTVSSAVPFRVSLSEAGNGNLPLSVTWEGKGEDDTVFDSGSGTYSGSDAVRLSIMSEKKAGEMRIDDYSASLVLSIAPSDE